MSALLELAERCEHAAHPDSQLDAAIWLKAVADDTGREAVRIGREQYGDAEAEFRISRLMDGRAYTSSIDAAMTLLPEGWVIGSVAEESPRTQWVVELRRGHRTSYDKVVFSEYEPGRRCATLALALCAASLRARAQ
jgi:hypothetical protein